MAFAGSSLSGLHSQEGEGPEGLEADLEFPEQLNCGQHPCFLLGLDFSFGRRLNCQVLPPGWGPKLETPPHTHTPAGPGARGASQFVNVINLEVSVFHRCN